MDYTREGDQLNAKCPENFRDVLEHQFIAGLDDRESRPGPSISRG